jgi:pimeloyl-ACP methyl ester carboxylesterase
VGVVAGVFLVAGGGGVGVGLAFDRFGSGQPLVLLHGLGHRRQAWGAVAGLLAPFRDVVVVDLPGHGESPPLRARGEPAVRVLLREVVGLLDELGLARPHVGGSSLGGRLALEVAARGRAASVTALSPAGFWVRDRELAYVRGVFWGMQRAGAALGPAGPVLAGTAAGRAVLYAAIVSRPSRVSAAQAAGDLAAFVAARPAMRAILAEAFPFAGTVPGQVPVTIGWGTRDLLLPPRQALTARARLPGARVVWLPGCGHVPMTDDPPLVADLLLAGSRLPVLAAPARGQAARRGGDAGLV